MRHLNLDIVLGIICTELFAQVVFAVHVRPAWWFVVPSAAWLMYTVDRLNDVRKQGADYTTARHRFHARHQRILWLAVALLAPSTAIVAFLDLLPDVWIVGVILGSLTLLHVATQQPGLRRYRGIVKDCTVIIVYTAAVWSVPLLRLQHHSLATTTVVVAFLCLATQNVLLFAMMEENSDASLDRPSIVRSLGARRALWLFHTVTFVLCLAAVILATSGAPHMLHAGIIVVVMTMILEATWAGRSVVAQHDIYRLLGDGIFYVPAVILLLQ